MFRRKVHLPCGYCGDSKILFGFLEFLCSTLPDFWACRQISTCITGGRCPVPSLAFVFLFFFAWPDFVCFGDGIYVLGRFLFFNFYFSLLSGACCFLRFSVQSCCTRKLFLMQVTIQKNKIKNKSSESTHPGFAFILIVIYFP